MDTSARCMWVFGGGRFGTRAVKMARDRLAGVRITLVDREASRCRELQSLVERVVVQDATEFLAGELKDREPEWIVPAVPVHLAFRWICRQLDRIRDFEFLPVPVNVRRRLPNPFAAPGDGIATSVADFICPPECPEPAETCTHTGRPRTFTLYRFLQEENFLPWKSVVVRSRQIFPGVGGYPPSALQEALETVRASNGPVLVSTACRCHGIVHGLQMNRGRSGIGASRQTEPPAERRTSG